MRLNRFLESSNGCVVHWQPEDISLLLWLLAYLAQIALPLLGCSSIHPTSLVLCPRTPCSVAFLITTQKREGSLRCDANGSYSWWSGLQWQKVDNCTIGEVSCWILLSNARFQDGNTPPLTPLTFYDPHPTPGIKLQPTQGIPTSTLRTTGLEYLMTAVIIAFCFIGCNDSAMRTAQDSDLACTESRQQGSGRYFVRLDKGFNLSRFVFWKTICLTITELTKS